MAIANAADAAAVQYEQNNPGGALQQTAQGGVVNNGQTVASNTAGLQQVNANQQYIQQAQAQEQQFAQEQAGTQALLSQQNALLREQATPAPVLNYQGILGQAQAQAAAPGSAVNQLYQSQLNNYLQNEAAQYGLNSSGQVTGSGYAQQQQQTAVTQAQQALANTQANLGQEQQFTGQQAGLNLANIANQQQAYQQNQGITGEQNMAQLRSQLGQSGLSASGLGGQQEFTQNLQRQVAENQQENSFAFQKNSELLSENNTFANIAQSGKYAQQTEAGQESSANINLQQLLTQAAASEVQNEASLSQWQQQAQQAAAQNLAAQQVTAFIQSYQGNPLLYSKAMQAYAPLTQGTEQPALPNLQLGNGSGV